MDIDFVTMAMAFAPYGFVISPSSSSSWIEQLLIVNGRASCGFCGASAMFSLSIQLAPLNWLVMPGPLAKHRGFGEPPSRGGTKPMKLRACPLSFCCQQGTWAHFSDTSTFLFFVSFSGAFLFTVRKQLQHTAIKSRVATDAAVLAR